MDRGPNLIAPVLIVACALIVVGGIGIELSQTAEPGTSPPLPISLQARGTTGATAEATGTATPMPTVTTRPPEVAGNGTSALANGTAGTDPNATATVVGTVAPPCQATARPA